MATLATIRSKVSEGLYSGNVTARPFESPITTSYNSAVTTIPVTDGTDWEEGDVAENSLTAEQMLVLSVSSNDLTVRRAYAGTTAAASSGTNDLLTKNPRFSLKQIDTAIGGVLGELGTWGIHAWGTGSITLAANKWYYDIADADIAEPFGVLAVYYVDDTTKEPVPIPFKFSAHLSTSDGDWSNAQGIRIHSKGDRSATASDVYYTYAKSYDLVSADLSTKVATLLDQHEDLVVLGALRSLTGDTVLPMTQDPGRRTDRSTSPGQTVRDGRWFQGEFFIKVRAEAARLAKQRQNLPRSRHTARAGRWRW